MSIPREIPQVKMKAPSTKTEVKETPPTIGKVSVAEGDPWYKGIVGDIETKMVKDYETGKKKRITIWIKLSYRNAGKKDDDNILIRRKENPDIDNTGYILGDIVKFQKQVANKQTGWSVAVKPEISEEFNPFPALIKKMSSIGERHRRMSLTKFLGSAFQYARKKAYMNKNGTDFEKDHNKVADKILSDVLKEHKMRFHTLTLEDKPSVLYTLL